jgi:hypothetical protein
MQGLEKLVSEGVEVVGRAEDVVVITYASLLMIGSVLATTFWCGSNPQNSAAAHSDR